MDRRTAPSERQRCSRGVSLTAGDKLSTYNIYLPDELRAENENILMIKGDKSMR